MITSDLFFLFRLVVPDLEDWGFDFCEQADMYTTMFKDATDFDHPCRVGGATYLRCVSDNYKQFSKTRQATCMASFKAFDGCRKETLDSQAKAVENSLVKQDIADRRAKSLFERRSILMDTQKC